jgi:hypothetical protein
MEDKGKMGVRSVSMRRNEWERLKAGLGETDPAFKCRETPPRT